MSSAASNEGLVKIGRPEDCFSVQRRLIEQGKPILPECLEAAEIPCVLPLGHQRSGTPSIAPNLDQHHLQDLSEATSDRPGSASGNLSSYLACVDLTGTFFLRQPFCVSARASDSVVICYLGRAGRVAVSEFRRMLWSACFSRVSRPDPDFGGRQPAGVDNQETAAALCLDTDTGSLLSLPAPRNSLRFFLRLLPWIAPTDLQKERACMCPCVVCWQRTSGLGWRESAQPYFPARILGTRLILSIL